MPSGQTHFYKSKKKISYKINFETDHAPWVSAVGHLFIWVPKIRLKIYSYLKRTLKNRLEGCVKA